MSSYWYVLFDIPNHAAGVEDWALDVFLFLFRSLIKFEFILVLNIFLVQSLFPHIVVLPYILKTCYIITRPGVTGVVLQKTFVMHLFIH